MKKICIVLAILICICGFSACNKKGSLHAIYSFSVQEDALETAYGKDAKVVLLMGQSNATGVALNTYFEKNDSEEYAKAVQGYDDVLINYMVDNGSNTSNGRFVKAVPGQGWKEGYFGPEVGLANKLAGQYNNATVFILKYTWSGTVLDYQWMNGKYGRGELYNAAISFFKTSLKYLKSKGYNVEIMAACWMQGESDAFVEETYSRYYTNTQKMVEYLRKDLNKYSDNKFIFVDAGIAEIDYLWVNSTKINDAKKKYAEDTEYSKYFSTQEMGLTTLYEPEESPDLAHYDSVSAFALGQKFGELIIEG